jgi:PAS domain S-box-containing protein
MKKTSDLKLILFFTALTFLLTVIVIFAWEKFLLPPFFSWVEGYYPGEAYAEVRNKVQQRIEHFFISVAVDMVVVTLLLRVVRGQQRKLSESEERYRAVFEHAGDGIGVVRAADFCLLEANDKFCEIFDCRPAEVVGRDLRTLLREDGERARVEEMARNLDGADSGERELIAETQAGARKPVAVSFSALEGTRGERLLVLIVRDLSGRRRLEAEKEAMRQQLYQTAKLASIGELSAGVAHEINNPLNGVINFAQLLKDEPVERSEFDQQMIDGIIEEGGRIAHIVRGLLTFARHDHHDLSSVRMNDVVVTSISLFGRQLEKDGIRVEVDVPKDLPLVHADASRLRQVVVNMISNAQHALRSKRDGERVFRVTARNVAREGGGHALRLEFYDNGVGIPADAREKVFDPFFTTRRDTGGTGLGLSISFGIVRDHGGTIRVESEEGAYTRFIVELPASGGRDADYA